MVSDESVLVLIDDAPIADNPLSALSSKRRVELLLHDKLDPVLTSNPLAELFIKLAVELIKETQDDPEMCIPFQLLLFIVTVFKTKYMLEEFSTRTPAPPLSLLTRVTF